MNIDADTLSVTVRKAFANRHMPKGRIINDSINLSYHLEAARVDVYLRDNEDIIDRRNSALVAFNYIKAEDALWILLFYIESILKFFEDDDYLLAVVSGALASGVPGASFTAQDDLGVKMRKLASDDEAKSVCQFCKWIQSNTAEIGLDETIAAALELWCA